MSSLIRVERETAVSDARNGIWGMCDGKIALIYDQDTRNMRVSLEIGEDDKRTVCLSIDDWREFLTDMDVEILDRGPTMHGRPGVDFA